MKSPSSSSPLSSAPDLLRLYKECEETGVLLFDESQQAGLHALAELQRSLICHARAGEHPRFSLSWIPAFAGMTKKKNTGNGVYLYGAVGRGKTMLMDLFFDSLPDDFPKARLHFHAFMLQVHDWLHEAQKGESAPLLDDVLIACADKYAASLRILCFDELVVRDVADAMLLSRLFERLFERGVAVVFTSNSAPEGLYEGGWLRERFLPFIALIRKHMRVVELTGARDFRLRHMGEADLYLDSRDPETQQRLEEDFRSLAQGQDGAPMTMLVKGHTLEVPRAAGRAAWFSFGDLCAKPLAAIDYLALCERFDAFIIDDVPVMGEAKRNEAKRFIALIDALYDTRRRLIVTAAAEPEELYIGHDHEFEFRRTASRLREMRTQAYWDGVG